MVGLGIGKETCTCGMGMGWIRRSMKKAFGNPIIGTWYAEDGKKEFFPNYIRAHEDEFEWIPAPEFPGWLHPGLNGVRLTYDEAM